MLPQLRRLQFCGSHLVLLCFATALANRFSKRYAFGMSISRRVFISVLFLIVEAPFAGFLLWGFFALVTVMSHWDATPSDTWNAFGYWMILLCSIGAGMFAMLAGYHYGPQIDTWLTRKSSRQWLTIVWCLVISGSLYGLWRYQHPVKMVSRWNPRKHVVELQPE